MSDHNNMTDGMHVFVEALKRNNIDTIYGVVGIPVTDMARHAQAEGIRYIGLHVVTKLTPVGARRLRWEVYICLSTGQAVNRFSF